MFKKLVIGAMSVGLFASITPGFASAEALNTSPQLVQTKAVKETYIVNQTVSVSKKRAKVASIPGTNGTITFSGRATGKGYIEIGGSKIVPYSDGTHTVKTLHLNPGKYDVYIVNEDSKDVTFDGTIYYNIN
ncbi:hypothetical protein AYJ08_00190 [Brevibacillus sp. SKDU10]|uniref:hypothetical protein n=1 Tax=Brevibacillus sp. SKDU10 TaxID=1247872 RepID=UPI0007C8B5AD|nr:hypothetical protein [Brevibacillus sp. SKDU10]OAJ75204.1 hypothetical protein AYJ08_00190 [Brevibacillus sp. SKDU10]